MTADDPPPEPPCGDPKHPCPPPPDLAPPSLYPPSPPLPSYSATSHGRSTALIIAGAVVAFLAVYLAVFVFLRRRRQRRRRQREALLEAALAPAAPPLADDGGGAAGPGVEEEVHHAWHIRTVGLDEAAIESIALTRYRAGGAPGASDDCTVCLGEFRDGELLRLLPKCAHAFHVQCIDTWLRAHVSCPLCRANVMDPATAAAAEQPDPTPPAAGAGAEQEHDAGDTGAPEHEPPGRHAHADEQRVLQIDPRHQPNISSEQPPGPRGRTFRRVASMDSPCPMATAEEDPGHEQAGGAEKHGEGGAVCCEVSPGSDDHMNRAAMERSLSAGSRWALLSRHCRARGSLLPL